MNGSLVTESLKLTSVNRFTEQNQRRFSLGTLLLDLQSLNKPFTKVLHDTPSFLHSFPFLSHVPRDPSD